MRILSTILLIVLVSIGAFSAENRALIILLKSVDNSGDYAQIMEQKLNKSGFKTQLLAGNSASKQTVTQYLEGYKKELSSDDKLLIFLLGYTTVSSKNIFLSTTGEKMTGSSFVNLIDEISAEKSIFLLNYNCGSLYGLFAKNSERYKMIFSADKNLKSRSTPLFVSFWCKNFPDNCRDEQNIYNSITKTADDLALYYQQKSLLQSENSIVKYLDKEYGYPYDKKMVIADSTAPSSIPKVVTLPALKKATAKTRSLVENIAKVANKYNDYPAFYFKRQLNLNIDKVENLNILITEIVLPRSNMALSRFGTIFPKKFGITKATIVYSSGDYMEYDLSNKIIENIPLQRGDILILEYNILIKESTKLPFFQYDLLLQKDIPTEELSININSQIALNQHLYNVKDQQANKLHFRDIPPLYKTANEAYSQDSVMKLTLTSLKDWDEFFSWIKRVNRDTLIVDDNSKKFITNLTSTAPNDYQKVVAIYNYMNNMRYLTLPIGVGAVRPQPIADILSNGYADCKDKATLLTAMCRAIGVDAYRVITKRFGRVDVNTPSWQFNHMICWIPQLENYPNGLFLDPTDGFTPFGELPPGDIGSMGMILDGDSYKFIEVTSSQSNPVMILEQNIVFAKDKDNFSAVVEHKFSDLALYYHRHKLSEASPLERELYYNSMLKELLINFDLTKVEETGNVVKLFATGGTVPEYIPLPFKLDTTFMLKNTPKDMQLFDGRRIKILRTIKYPYPHLKAEKIAKKSSPIELKIVREESSELLEIQFNNKIISQEDYSIIKRTIQEVGR